MFDNLFSLVGSGPSGGASHSSNPSCLSNDELHCAIVTLAGHLAAAKCAWLDLVGEMDAREMFYEWGCKSAADWLSVRCGIGLGTAFEYVRVARAISQFPLIHECFASGQLSYSKVRAITRVVTRSNEKTLVGYAQYGTGAQLEKIVGAFRGAREAADPDLAARRLARRYLRYSFQADGSLVGSFRLPPEAGAIVIAALQAAQRELDDDERDATVSTGVVAESSGRERGTAESPGGESSAPPNLVSGTSAGDKVVSLSDWIVKPRSCGVK